MKRQLIKGYIIPNFNKPNKYVKIKQPSLSQFSRPSLKTLVLLQSMSL